MRRIRAGVLLVIMLAAVAGAWTPSPATAQDAPTSPEQQLVDRYLPVLYLRTQEAACARPPHGGEPYLPVPVEMVLGNERVLLRDGADGDRVLDTGVDAPALAQQHEDTYLDFPGDPRRPGCTFETDERLRIEELGFTPTTYARIVADPANHRLVVQYWFFYYFNDWNNTHEADWEMVQVMWDDAGSVGEALAQEPSRTAFSQHSAGERGIWGEDKLELEDGTHPRVYTAAGSHASFYSSKTYLQWGENNSGFGCDLTTGPSTRVEVTPLIVEEPIDPNGPFAWLLYPGRWGERQISVFNGVHGPGFNLRWLDPWEATENWPERNIIVPGGKTFGPTATSDFCSLVETGSSALILAKIYPVMAIPAIGAVVAGVAFLYKRSRDIYRRARKLYRLHWKLFTRIGLVAIPIGIAFNVIEEYLVERRPVLPVVQWLGNSAGAHLSWVLTVGGVQQLAMLLVIGPAVIQAVADIHHGERPSVRRSYRLAARRVWPVALAGLLVVMLTGVPLMLLIGIPVSIWLVVKFQYFSQALMFDKQCSSLDSLRESSRLVRGYWWRTAFAALLFDLLATIPGVVVGFSLLTLGRTAVSFANGVSSLLYALLIPVSVIAVTIMFMDRRGDPIQVGVEGGSEPAEP